MLAHEQIVNGLAGRPNLQQKLRNKLDCLNVAIVMYGQVPRFEALCAPLSDCRIIHLLRHPKNVALSVAQLRADHDRYPDLQAHYRKDEMPPPHAPASAELAERYFEKVSRLQQVFHARFSDHANVLTVSYEEMTQDREISELPEAVTVRLLDFLGLRYRSLTNGLRKTGSTGAGSPGSRG